MLFLIHFISNHYKVQLVYLLGPIKKGKLSPCTVVHGHKTWSDNEVRNTNIESLQKNTKFRFTDRERQTKTKTCHQFLRGIKFLIHRIAANLFQQKSLIFM